MDIRCAHIVDYARPVTKAQPLMLLWQNGIRMRIVVMLCADCEDLMPLGNPFPIVTDNGRYQATLTSGGLRQEKFLRDARSGRPPLRAPMPRTFFVGSHRFIGGGDALTRQQQLARAAQLFGLGNLTAAQMQEAARRIQGASPRTCTTDNPSSMTA